MAIKEIKICPTCKGYGTVEYPDRHGSYDKLVCNSCQGSGRIIETITKETRPFNEKRDIHNQ